MNLHYFQHVAFEDLADIEDWARLNHHTISATRFHLNESPPDLNAVDALVVLGGPMNIYEEDLYPWLAVEKGFLREAIASGKPVLGICLGAQLIADVLGAKVVQNPHKEIGWFPIRLTEPATTCSLFQGLPQSFSVFHWHGDTFDLPDNAVHLAESDACKNQAFHYGERVLGLQFHLESNREAIQRMIQHESADMTEGRFVQSAEEILSQENYFQGNCKILNTLLERFFRCPID
jgi:GMP synthase-like glutamine amidotransferase